MIDSVYLVQDRYGGTYSHGKWIAVANPFEDPSGITWMVDNLGTEERWRFEDRIELVHLIALGDDVNCANFWDEVRTKNIKWIAVGNTPTQAYDNLG